MSKWYEKTLEEKSNIIYSRIRLARNWDEYVFPSRLDEEGSRELVDGLKDGLKEIPYPYYALENMQQAEKKALRERRILNRCAVEKTYAQGLYLSEDESESILLGADDHIRMQFWHLVCALKSCGRKQMLQTTGSMNISLMPMMKNMVI